MIKLLGWEEIRHIWATELWVDRKSAIEPQSAMLFKTGHDMDNFNYLPRFFGYYLGSKLVGVNSGHGCSDGSYRSRGLWVNENNRNTGIGTRLLRACIDQALVEQRSYIWSYPRYTSWPVYKNAGFVLSSEWAVSETNNSNAFAKIDLKSIRNIDF